MNKKQKLEEVSNAMRYTGETPEKGERAEIYLFSGGGVLLVAIAQTALVIQNLWN